MNLNSGDRITGVTRFKEVEVDENDSQENANPQEIVIASIENPAAQQAEEMTSVDSVVEETDSETQE